MTPFDADLCNAGDHAPFGVWPPFGETRCGAKPIKGGGSCGRIDGHHGQHVSVAGMPPNHLQVSRTWWGHPDCRACSHPEALHRQAGPATWVCDAQHIGRACNCDGYRSNP